MSHAAFDIDELEALANAATPGPWERYNPCDEDCKDCRSTEYVHGAQDAIIRKGHRFDGEIITCDSGAYGPKLADANFIVTARIAVPALIVALRAARKDSVRQAQQAIEWSKIAGSYIAKPDKARATVSNGLELAKVYQAMDNGFDDSRWPPGLTAVDALIRERDDALRDARAMDEAHCAAIKRAEVAEKELAKYKEIATSQHYAFNAERDGLRLRVEAAELQSAASVAGNVELGSLVKKYQQDVRDLRAENERLRLWLGEALNELGHCFGGPQDQNADEANLLANIRAALSPQAEEPTNGEPYCEICHCAEWLHHSPNIYTGKVDTRGQPYPKACGEFTPPDSPPSTPVCKTCGGSRGSVVTEHCTAECWTIVYCAACGQQKLPVGHGAPSLYRFCDDDCPAYRLPPKPPHLWPDEAHEPEDHTPWCTGCGALQKSQCDCGPRAENE